MSNISVSVFKVQQLILQSVLINISDDIFRTEILGMKPMVQVLTLYSLVEFHHCFGTVL